MSSAEKIEGTLVSVEPMAGTFVVKTDDDQYVHLRLLDPRYWATGSSMRAYQAALRLRSKTGRRVSVNAEHHSAFGLAVFGASKIKTASTAKRKRR